MRICVVTPRFSLSGVPLAQVRMARALAAAGADVDLVIGAVNEGQSMPDVAGVRVTILGKARVVGMLWPFARYLRRERPDVVFSAEDHLNIIVLLAAKLARSRAKISGSSRVTPFDTYRNKPKARLLKVAMRLVMSRADVLTCVSRDMVEQYRQVFHDPPHVAVYNIIVDSEAAARMREPVTDEWFQRTRHSSPPLLVAAGALGPWKGFTDLIRAMAILVRDRPEARLVILGDGEQRADLEALVAELSLGANVRLPGFVENPLKYFHRADVFVLSSLVEGLPNVLVEAMMCGCTPVATDCPTGPREVLQNGRIGKLVPMRDPAALAHAMAEAIGQPVSKQVLDAAVRPFRTDAVLKCHFELLGVPLPTRPV